MERIYCVEDDESIRELTLYALRSSGFEVQGFERGSEFFAAAKIAKPDLLLLDIMLPDEDGLSILARIRADAELARLPVILLTAKSTEFDKVKGLDSGADDYVAKPFGVMELLSRVRAVLRRTMSEPESKQNILESDGISVDMARRVAHVDGTEVVLTYKEFELLAFLLRNRDLALSRDKLMEAVWGFDFEGESRTVDMHIKSLRQKLGNRGDCIQTVRGVGYKLTLTAGKEEHL
ncbi:MAG: response regulator transcription factor [Angelakisella sp.]|nr:response regulator transcription factor [Angelakisella sp.]